jgi:hypothetical protein
MGSPVSGSDPWVNGDEALYRQMVRSYTRERCDVRMYVKQNLRRQDPDTVQRKKGQPRRERSRRRRSAQSGIQPAQWTAPEDPLVDVAQHDDKSVLSQRKGLKQPSHLIPAFGGAEAKVGDDHPYDLPLDREVCVNGTAWFPAGDTQVE